MVEEQVVKAALAYLKKRARCPSARLWSFEMGPANIERKSASDPLGLSEISPSLYSLRHGGASRDLLERRRTVQEVKIRGRWQSDSSLRRYAKATKLVDVISRVPPETLAKGQLVIDNIHNIMVS